MTDLFDNPIIGRKPITHSELCKLTAERFSKDSSVTVWEYQSFASGEFPDVLCFNSITKLYEIKISRSDFLADDSKDCRRKVYIKYGFYYGSDIKSLMHLYLKKTGLDTWYQEAPHLGRRRYYVCSSGLIQPEEIKNGFGLYWYNGKFSKKKESENFRNNVYEEMSILCHAFRKHAGGKAENIIIQRY
jgi:hypothetical protein